MLARPAPATIGAIEEPMEDWMAWSLRRAIGRMGDVGRTDADLVERARNEARDARTRAVHAETKAQNASIEALEANRSANFVKVEMQMLSEIVAALLACVAFEAGKNDDAEEYLDRLLATPRGMQELSEEGGVANEVTKRRRSLLAHVSDAARSHLATLLPR